MIRAIALVPLGAVLALGACAYPAPTAPTVLALPAPGTDLARFQQEDASCRGYAAILTGGASPTAAASTAGVGTAVIGTALGAAAGAAIGAAAGNAGTGAAIGAGAGLLGGTAAGAANANAVGGSLQAQFDNAYTQCMYADGNKVVAQSVPVATTSPGYAYAPDYGYAPGYIAPYAPAYVTPPVVAFGFSSGYRWHDNDGWRDRAWRGGDWHGGNWHGGDSHGGAARWQEPPRARAAAPAPAPVPHFPTGGGGFRAQAAAPVQGEPHRDAWTSEAGR
jgi:hypothetical protein